MKKMTSWFFKAFFVITLLGVTAGIQAQQLAFPTAEGYGAYAKGGRNGKVILVTNLNDSGPGSLRAAVEDTEPRTVIFRVSGTIILKSELYVKSSFITIAGQTAPGDGICLRDFPLIVSGANDVIIRFIRVRPGVESGLPGDDIDGIRLERCKNVILDHCTASWSVDEILNTWHGAENITVQWSIFAEALNRSVHQSGAHGFAASLGGHKATYHHNLFANCSARNPSVAGNHMEKTELMDFRNNVVFNWVHRSCDGKPSSINFVYNYYKPGPATNPDVRRRLVRVESAEGYHFQAHWYIHGNYMDGYPEISANNMNGGIDYDKNLKIEDYLESKPYETMKINTQTPKEAYKAVLKNAGVTVPGRDSEERRIIKEVKKGKTTYGNGIIDNVEQVGGWPVLDSKEPPLDSDNDGIPDEWEIKHNLDPSDPSDANLDSNQNGYTNLEDYLNSLVHD